MRKSTFSDWRTVLIIVAIISIAIFMNFAQIRAQVKRVASYTKTEWTFEDYPLHTWKNPNAGEEKVTYGAGLVNWAGLVGHGETPEKAVIALRGNFELFRTSGGILPRPGTVVPIKFALSDNIDRYSDLAGDFLMRIFGLDIRDGFISDDTKLGDFISMDPPEEEGFKQRTIDRIRSIYKIDVADIYDEPLWVILESIKNQ